MTASPGSRGNPDEPLLFRHFPRVRQTVPWISLGTAPTPVERVRRPDGSTLWVKRDDLSAPQYGGNKVRKLEFLLGEARARGARRLITVGAAGSHHALATALYGRRHDFAVTLVLFPQPFTEHVREVLLADSALGADLRWAPRMEAIPAVALLARLAHRAEGPFMIPAGGSSPAGALGYVNAALELAEQVREGLLPAPDLIHLAAGTLGTVAGLAIGLELAGLGARIHAVRIASPLVTSERALRRLVTGAAGILSSAGVPVGDTSRIVGRVELTHDWIGAGYGVPTPAGDEASVTLSPALALDPTYTAKAAGATLARLAAEPERIHLFWHTLSAAAPDLGGPLPDASGLPRSFRRYLAGVVGTPNRSGT